MYYIYYIYETYVKQTYDIEDDKGNIKLVHMTWQSILGIPYPCCTIQLLHCTICVDIDMNICIWIYCWYTIYKRHCRAIYWMCTRCTQAFTGVQKCKITPNVHQTSMIILKQHLTKVILEHIHVQLQLLVLK